MYIGLAYKKKTGKHIYFYLLKKSFVRFRAMENETNSSKVGGNVFDEKGFKEATSQAAKDYEVAYNNEPSIEFQGKLKTPSQAKKSIDSFKTLLGNPNYVQESLIRDINYLESQLSNWIQSKGYTRFIGSPAHIAGIPSRILGGKSTTRP